MMKKEILKKAIEDGYSLQIRKYQRFGSYSSWKMVDLEKALHKLSVFVENDNGSVDCPYEVRVVYEYKGEWIAR